MKVNFLSIAQKEFNKAISFYNKQSEGLGFDFALEVKRTICRIKYYPEAWNSLSKRTRRCRISRFSYGVIYQIREKSILIISVMHLHKKPDSWRKYFND